MLPPCVFSIYKTTPVLPGHAPTHVRENNAPGFADVEKAIAEYGRKAKEVRQVNCACIFIRHPVGVSEIPLQNESSPRVLRGVACLLSPSAIS